MHDCPEWPGRDEYPQPPGIERVTKESKESRLRDAILRGRGRGSPIFWAFWAVPVDLEPIFDPLSAQPRFEGGVDAHQHSTLKYMPRPATQAKAVIAGSGGLSGVIPDRQKLVAPSALDAPIGLQKLSRCCHRTIMDPGFGMSIGTNEGKSGQPRPKHIPHLEAHVPRGTVR